MKISFADIIVSLSNQYYKSDSEEIESLLLNTRDFYSENRIHSYATLSQIVFGLSDEDDNEVLLQNLSTLLSKSRERELTGLMENIEKLIDHTNLAINQKQYVDNNINRIENEYRELTNSLKEQLATAETKIQELTSETEKTSIDSQTLGQETTDLMLKVISIDKTLEDFSKTKESINDLEKSKNRMYTEFVTILGIFSAIIFATFGGLQIISNTLNDIANAPTGKLLLFSSLSVSATTILLFILLNGVAKLTGLNLRSCGCSSKDKNCNHNIFQKHPTIIITNLVLFYISILGVTNYFTEYELLLKSLFSGEEIHITLVTTFLFLLISLYVIWKVFKHNYYNLDYIPTLRERTIMQPVTLERWLISLSISLIVGLIIVLIVF